MSEELDNELRKRISEVFDNYEDTAPAEEGWLLLRQKFPEQKKRRIVPMWWMSAAAVLLLLATFGLWFFNQQPQKNDQVAVKPHKQNAQPLEQNTPQSPSPELPNSIQNSTVVNSLRNGQTSQLAGRVPQSQKPALNNNANVATTPSADVFNATVTGDLPSKAQVNASAPNNASLPTSGNSKVISGIAAADVINNSDSINKSIQQAILAQQNPVKTPQQRNSIISTKDTTANTANQSKMMAFLTREQEKEDAKKDKTENKLNADKKVLYSIYAATYFNYAEGSRSQVNTGAGFSTDIRLSKNFKVSTGIAIGKNTLSYANQPVSAGIQNAAMAASNNAMVEVIPISKNNQLGFTPLKVAASPLVSAYDVSLTGLDVPINIKYEFNPAKTDAYISAGLSSGTFINETFSYRYTNDANYSIATSEVPDASSSKNFTGFNFARTLNVSMGVGYQITKSNRLVIEPFLKYPLGGLGSQQIRFGAGGINLRFKFQTAKK